MIATTSFQQTSVLSVLGGGATALPPESAAAGQPTMQRDVVLAPGIASQLLIGQVANPSESLPVSNTQNGNLFNDRNDPGLSWYLPAFALANPDTGFAFAADQTSVDAEGNPFNQATLSLDVCAVDPPDVQQVRQQTPDARLQQIPFVSLGATLTLPYKDDNGNDQQRTLSGDMAPQADGTFKLSFSGLLGAAVVQAYQQLTQLGNASIQLQLTYRVWHQGARVQPGPGPGPEPVRIMPAIMAVQPVNDWGRPPVATRIMPIGGPPRAVDPVLLHPMPVRPPVPVPSPQPAPADPGRVGTAQLTSSVQLGSAYAADPYRSAYTLSAEGTSRVIIDVTDLRDFDVDRSEFIELTSLGDVQSKYPSFQRLYLGEVTGVIVAIPSAYGVVQGSGGCAAHLDALVDDSPTTLSGSWFQFTCTVAPVVDPIDLAQLAQDLLAIPEAAARRLRLTLPSGLDSRWPATLDVSGASNTTFAQGSTDHTLLISLDLRDDGATPAITAVNLFLGQLCLPIQTPLFGQLSLHLDDVYTPAVTATVLLNLHATSCSDDLSVSVAGSPTTVTVTNNAPLDLHLLRFAGCDSQGMSVTAFDQVLAAAQPCTLPLSAPADTTSVFVGRSLALADPFPENCLRQYVSIKTETVQQTQHPLGLNATAVDFAANGIAELDIQITLNDLPDLTIPSLVLTPSHQVDSVNALIPIESVVNGLAATLTITVVASDPTANRQVQVSHDYMSDPLFVLTPSALA